MDCGSKRFLNASKWYIRDCCLYFLLKPSAFQWGVAPLGLGNSTSFREILHTEKCIQHTSDLQLHCTENFLGGWLRSLLPACGGSTKWPPTSRNTNYHVQAKLEIISPRGLDLKLTPECEFPIQESGSQRGFIWYIWKLNLNFDRLGIKHHKILQCSGQHL